MFADNSRYKKVETMTVTQADGTSVVAIKLRRLPAVRGQETILQKQDRLDLLAGKTYKDDSKFWHIADANSSLEADELAEANSTIIVPQQ